MPKPAPEQSTCAIVGIGASAGGLDALRRLLGALPASPPFAVVVVQHLDPSTRSMLAEIIDRSCDLKVVRARSGSVLAPGTVYVVPEGREPFVENGRLQLGKRSKTCSEPIDTLFASLATHNRVSGCGVVLSGNGADGTIGLRKIRGAGGLTFAQDPSTAEFPGMPSAAVEAGVADFVGSPEQIARDLMAHLRYEALGGPPITTRKSKAAADREAKARDRILALIRVDSGMDFSGYKTTTVMRRIHRRVMLGDAQSLEAYAESIDADAAERAALFDDLLINVTEFFRDADVFEALRTRVFPEVLKSKADEDTLRIWVVGCSTGEEVYSVLITALEAMEAAGSPRKVTVFGTDASESSIARARAGVYPQSICASVSPERLSRYFVRTDAGFEIDRALRDMCVFARQDITKDTPFSRLDLVSLRNVLIYMDQPLQSQVLAVAHFALQPDGVLLLGTSETPETEARLFRAYDKQNHVYRRQDVAPRLPVDIANAARASIGSLPVAPPGLAFDIDTHDAHKTADEVSLLLYAPPRVVVDADGHILHFFGDTSPYLEHAAGRATLDASEMAQPGIALELKDALEAANAADGSATRAANFISGGERRHVSIEITPLPSPAGSPQLMIAFREIAAESASEGPATNEDLAPLYEAREQRVRGELGVMRARLRTVAEEKEQVNQSLRSANEEIRSSNEELQSINEELETAKEELQSANEELITVNDELRHSNSDLGLVNDDLTNFTASIDVPVIMLDRSLRVRRFTPQATRVVRIEDADLGRLLEHLKLRVGVADLPGIAARVIETDTPSDLEVQDENGRWYTMSLRPYRSAEGCTDGVVIAFSDVDELRRSADRLERRARLGDALTRIDADLASTLEFDTIMQRALDDGVKAIGADAGAIEVREGAEWVVRYQNGFPSDDVGLRLSEAEAPNATQTAGTGELLTIADMPADEQVNVGFVKAHGLKSVLAVPLLVRGDVVGCLLFYTRHKPRVFTAGEIDFGRRLGTSVSLALENSRLFHAERDATQRAETLNAINEIIRSAITPQDLLGRLVDEASKVAGADKCLVVEVHGDQFTITHVRNVRDDLVGEPRTADYFPGFARAMRERRPVLIGDTWTDPRTNKDFVVPYALRALQLLPLIVDDSVVAVLALAYDEPKTFDAADEDFSERVSKAMSVALKNATLLDSETLARCEAKRELETTALLLEAARVLARPEDLGTRLGALAGLVSSSLVHDRVVFNLWDEQTRLVQVVAVAGGAGPAQDVFAWEELSSPGRLAIETGRSAVIDYGQESEAVRGISQQAGFRLALAVPMVSARGTVGLILADKPSESVAFTEREIELLDSIAGQAATAVENTRLFESEARRAHRMAVLQRIAGVAASSLSVSEVSASIVEAVSTAFGAARVLTTLMRGDRLVPLVGIGFPEGFIEGIGSFPPDSESMAVYLADAPRFQEDLESVDLSDFAQSFAQTAGGRSHIGLPLIAGGTRLGTLSLMWGEPRAFPREELDFLESVAAECTIGIQNALLFEAEQAARLSGEARAERVGLLKEIADIASSSLDSHAVAARVVEGVQRLLGAEQVQIRLVSEDGTSLVSEAVVDSADGYLAKLGAIPVDAALETAACFRSKKIRFSEDVAHAKVTKGSKTNARKSGIRAYALLPLVSRGEGLGILYLAWTEPRGFSAEDVSFFEAVAAQFVVGLENARLFEAEVAAQALAKRELETTTTLLEAATAFARWTDLTDVAHGLAESLIRSTAHTRVIVSLWHEADQELVVAASAGKDRLQVGERWPLDQVSVAAQKAVLERQSNVWDLDVVSGPERGVAVDELQMHVALYVPLVQRDTVVGLLIVDDPSERREFSDRDIELMEAIGAQAAVAIENARLFEAEVAAQHRLMEELERTTSLFEAEQQSRQRVEALHELTELATSSLDLAEVADRALHYVHDQLGVDVVTFWMLDDRGTRLFPVSGVGFPQAFYDGFASGVGLDDPFVIADAVKQGQPIVRTGGGIDQVPEPVRASYAKYGVDLRTLLVLPVNGRAGVIGAVTLAWSTPREMDADEIRFFSSVANELAIATENATLYDAKELELQRTITLAAVATAASSSLGLTEICQSVAEELRALPDVAAATIYSLEAERDVLRNLAVFGYPDDMDVWLSELPVDDSSNIGRIAASGLSLLTHEDPGNPAEVPARLAHMGIPSARWVSLPIESAGRLMGVIGLIFHGERPFDPQEVTLFKGIADTLAAALANARLFETEQAQLNRTTVLKEVAAIGACTFDVHELAAGALDAIQRLLGATAGNVFVRDEAAGVLRSAANLGIPEDARGPYEKLPLDSDAASARVALNGEPLTSDDDVPGSTTRTAQLTGLADGRWVILPVKSRGMTIGTLGLSFDGKRPFGSDEMSLFESIADQIGVGMDKAAMLETVSRQAELQRVIGEAAATLASSLEVEIALPAVLDAASQALGASGAVLFMREPGMWRTAAVCGVRAERFDAVRMDEDAPSLMHVLRTREPLFVADASTAEHADPALADRMGYRSFIAYPVLHRDEVTAVMAFSFEDVRQPLTEAELGFLARLAFTIGVTDENARLYAREHRIASTLQEAILMPPDEVAGIETAHVYRPASNEANVGGDYYDVFSLDDRHVGIVVGDIAGKGIGAARLTSLLRHGIRAYAFETHDPAAVLGLANTLVHRSVAVGEFSTVFFGVLEIPTGRFRYSCAGHPPPMIAHADGTVSPLETRSPVLGAFEGVRFRLSEDVELAVGDTLVLYTDGVTEARRDREMFGEMRLMVTLGKLRGTPVSELPGALLSEVLDFSGGHLRDDTIILCVARTAENA